MSAYQVHPDRLHNGSHGEALSPRGFHQGGRGGGAWRGGGRGMNPAGSNGIGSIPTGSISKLKAQLRQSKRLLARDDLNSDVRVTTERRVKILEAELEKTSTSELEKKMVSKYRGVRFFERQKTLRKIKQTKKALIASPDNAALEKTLIESRIDLYYILTYPKTEKYIALFPEGKYIPHGDSSKLSGPSKSIGGPKAKDADSTRQDLRSSIRHKIENGTLRAEAEGGDLGIEGEEDVGAGGVPEDVEEGKKGQNTATKELNSNGKRSMNSEQPEEEEAEQEQEEVAETEKGEKEKEGTTNRKKAKESKKPIAVPLDMVEAHSAEATTKRVAVDESDPKETKKQKKDRKDLQRKLKKEAELKAKASTDEQPNTMEESAMSAAPAVKAEHPSASNWGKADEFFA